MNAQVQVAFSNLYRVSHRAEMKFLISAFWNEVITPILLLNQSIDDASISTNTTYQSLKVDHRQVYEGSSADSTQTLLDEFETNFYHNW